MKRAILFTLAVGCTPVDSNVVATANLRADIQVLSTGEGGSTVYAWLFSHEAGSPLLNEDTIRLVDNDAITALSNGSSIAMREADLGVEYRYDATFASAEPDQSYQIGLARSADIGAPDSYVTLPDPFTPSAPTTSSRSAPLTITWTPGDSDQISINVTGCASAQLGPLPDTGTATFPAGTIVADPSNPPNNPTCDLAFAVSRTRNGTLDRAYGQGGSVVAIQRRTIMISSAP